jgi:hypothetical protein
MRRESKRRKMDFSYGKKNITCSWERDGVLQRCDRGWMNSGEHEVIMGGRIGRYAREWWSCFLTVFATQSFGADERENKKI